MTQRRNSLSDPDYAAFAWGRFRRVLWWMSGATVLTVLAALWYLRSAVGPLPLALILGTIGGVGLTMLVGSALMGLVFLSSGSGHDEDVAEFEKDPQ